MTEPHPSVAMQAGRTILAALVASGITDVVVCPGSRSAPLAYAAADLASAGRLRLTVRVDERSAGFFALGVAKATGRAAVVVTTSGTAVANLAPALLEARHAGVPLIALTADRPATLIGTGANQTADQTEVLRGIVRGVVRVSDTAANPAAWRAAIGRATVVAEGRLTRLPGPVHVNVELTPPLTGDPGPWPNRDPAEVGAWPAPPPQALRDGPRTVIVAGDLPPTTGQTLARSAARWGVPLLAEPSSNARRGAAAIATYRHLLPGFAHLIERAIVVGHPTLSRPVGALVQRDDVEIVAVASHAEWVDAGWAVDTVVPGFTLGHGDAAWLGQWRQADAALRRLVGSARSMDGEQLAAAVVAATPAEHAVVLGASNAIRDADVAPVVPRPAPVYANRGLAGIDGTIATALGVATGREAPVVALVGDLTGTHDLTSLALPRGEPIPDVTVVVADDGGGSLFASLEYGAQAATSDTEARRFERVFAVPTPVDWRAAALAFGAACDEVTTLAAVQRRLRTAHRGLGVVHVVISRDARRAREEAWVAAGRAAVRAVLEGAHSPTT